MADTSNANANTEPPGDSGDGAGIGATNSGQGLVLPHHLVTFHQKYSKWFNGFS